MVRLGSKYAIKKRSSDAALKRVRLSAPLAIPSAVGLRQPSSVLIFSAGFLHLAYLANLTPLISSRRTVLLLHLISSLQLFSHSLPLLSKSHTVCG